MIELVMAIVVIGILAALAMPRIDRDIRQEAADNVLSAIRYTQHLALMDDKTNPSDGNWQRRLWHMRFEEYGGNTKWFYNISASRDGNGNVDTNEVAIDPSNGKRMDNTNSATLMRDSLATDSPNVFLTEKYGINAIDFTNCNVQTGAQGTSNAQHIAFDYLGRPHNGIYGATNTYSTVMHGDCTLVFGFSDNSISDFNVTIIQETGYAFIGGQDDS